MIAFSIGASGFLALLATPHPRLPGLTYGLLFPAATGIYSPLMPLLAWIGERSETRCSRKEAQLTDSSE